MFESKKEFRVNEKNIKKSEGYVHLEDVLKLGELNQLCVFSKLVKK